MFKEKHERANWNLNRYIPLCFTVTDISLLIVGEIEILIAFAVCNQRKSISFEIGK